MLVLKWLLKVQTLYNPFVKHTPNIMYFTTKSKVLTAMSNRKGFVPFNVALLGPPPV